MSTTSTVVAFRAALLEGLRDHATITADGIQVADGWQGPDTADEGIYLTELRYTSTPTAFGPTRMPRQEDYEQTVVIQTWRAAETPTEQAAAIERVLTLHGALEDVLALDPKIGGTSFARLQAGELLPVPFETGWMARFTVVVACSAHLT
jgi:hypothetical protein